MLSDARRSVQANLVDRPNKSSTKLHAFSRAEKNIAKEQDLKQNAKTPPVEVLLAYGHNHISLRCPRPRTKFFRFGTRPPVPILLIHDRRRGSRFPRRLVLGRELRLHVLLEQGDCGSERVRRRHGLRVEIFDWCAWLCGLDFG